MFLVLSFDFGGTSFVKLHAFTPALDKAETVYDQLTREWHDYNQKMEKEGVRFLISIVEVNEFLSAEMDVDLFFGNPDQTGSKPKIIKSNNF
jgi:hypothetical protein